MQTFSKIALPLTNLLNKMTKFEWSTKCEQAFQELKKRLNITPVVTLPKEGKEHTIYSYASTNGLGCVLMQDRKVIANV